MAVDRSFELCCRLDRRRLDRRSGVVSDGNTPASDSGYRQHSTQDRSASGGVKPQTRRASAPGDFVGIRRCFRLRPFPCRGPRQHPNPRAKRLITRRGLLVCSRLSRTTQLALKGIKAMSKNSTLTVIRKNGRPYPVRIQQARKRGREMTP